MSKIYFIAIFVSSILSAQMSLGKYETGSGKLFNIELTQKKFLTVDLPSTDNLSHDIFLKLSFNKAAAFKEKINEAKNKYQDWKITAEKNNVKEFEKKITVDIGRYDMVFNYGSDYFFAKNVELEAYMSVNQSGVYFILKNKYDIVADANQFIKTEGFLLIFSEVDQISNFIKSIDLVKGENMYKENRNSNKLFQ